MTPTCAKRTLEVVVLTAMIACAKPHKAQSVDLPVDAVPTPMPPAPVDLESLAKKAVMLHSGHLTYCYELRLKVVPNLEGRVEMAWSLTQGQVSDVRAIANTTGDSELATCLAQRIEKWDFDPSASGDLSWPFVFRRKH